VLPAAAGLVVAAIAAGTVSYTLAGHDSSTQQQGMSAASDSSRTLEQRASRSKPRSTATTSPSPNASTRVDAATLPETSQYGGECHAGYVATGTVTASGTKFNPNAATGSNLSLPFGTKVRITNEANNKSVVITINDRGPYSGDRCFDLTSSAYKQIATLTVSEVKIEYEVLS